MTKTKKVGGIHAAGRDYSRPLVEMLPQIIGKKAKTIPEIADEAQRSNQSVQGLFARLKKIGGVIHIKSWKRGMYGGKITPCYLYGPGEDAKKPRPYTRSECVARYQRTDKGRAAKDRYLSKKKGASSVISATLNLNPLMSILYGSHRKPAEPEGAMHDGHL
jgi:hypothetical protein